jgi:hypothetical protein
LALLGALLPPVEAEAHGRSLSYSSWHMTEGGAHVNVRIPLLELSRLDIPLPVRGAGGRPAGTDTVGEYLSRRLQLLTPTGPCVVAGTPLARSTEEGWALYQWRVSCPESGDRTIETRILLDVAPSHLHFVRVKLAESAGEGPRIVERVLSDGQPSWSITSSTASPGEPEQDASGTGFTGYVMLGIEHILSGWDHLAFVLALVLLAGRVGEVARLVTGFTLAHSITLALAVLGLVHPRAAPVEAVIGFSVALIAAENAWLLGRRSPWVPWVTTGGLALAAGLAAAGLGQLSVLTLLGLALFSACHFALLGRSANPTLQRVALAFAFGLVHGFGFAGVLAEMTLPTERLAAALLGFNVGVELGQLAVVALVWPMLVALRRVGTGRAHRVFAEVASAAVCGTGVFWFISRAFGQG